MSETPPKSRSDTYEYLKGTGREAVGKFMVEADGESDRACVVISAIMLEAELEKLLKRKLLPNPSSGDDLFDQMKPLGTFSSKIDMAYRLGLIPPEGAKVLHLIRKMRNHVAHHLNEASFQSNSKQDRVGEAIRTLGLEEWFRANTSSGDLEDTVRARFEILMGWILAAMNETKVATVDGAEASGPMWKSVADEMKLKAGL